MQMRNSTSSQVRTNFVKANNRCTDVSIHVDSSTLKFSYAASSE